jgi:hypothetical protein
VSRAPRERAREVAQGCKGVYCIKTAQPRRTLTPGAAADIIVFFELS